MKPLIHPAVLTLICPSKLRASTRATQDEQAEAAGVTRRTFVRKIRESWDQWRVYNAERWCEYCGINYWKLAEDAQVTPKMLRLTTWDINDVRVRKALEMACRSMGVEPTRDRLEKIAWTLRTAAQGYVGAPAGS